MIVPIETSARAYIEQLRNQARWLEGQQVEYLIIAHSDQTMIQALSEAMTDVAAVALNFPQCAWQMDHGDIREILQWSTEALSIKGVLLVGHSRGGTYVDHVQSHGNENAVDPTDAPDGHNENGSLFGRIQAAQLCLKKNEDQFVTQLEILQRVVADLDSSVAVSGLFYRAESQFFCVYDLQKSAFRALVSA